METICGRPTREWLLRRAVFWLALLITLLSLCLWRASAGSMGERAYWTMPSYSQAVDGR